MSWKVPVLLAYIAAVTPSFAADLAARGKLANLEFDLVS